MTLKRLELEKELNLIRRAQANDFNQAMTQRTSMPMRDSATGDMGLLMKNGEVMTPEKLQKQMEISARYMESLQMSEKLNRRLTEENQTLKEANERMQAEMRRLEKALNGFEKTRRYDTFTDTQHRETLALNERLADELEKLERRMRALEEDHTILSRQCRRAAAVADRVTIADEDEEEESISSYITSDGRIPSKCPCNPDGCSALYERHVIDSTNPASAFTEHMTKTHQVEIDFLTESYRPLIRRHTVRALQAACQRDSKACPRTCMRQKEACVHVNPNPKETAASGRRGRTRPDLKNTYICPGIEDTQPMNRIQTLRRLDKYLLIMLGPPMPTTKEQTELWIPEKKETSNQLPTPVLERWDPPVWVPRRNDGGYWLANNVACFQRGYIPSAMYDSYLEASAVCFQSTYESEKTGLQGMAFDFLIVIVTPVPDEKTASGCVIELRPALDPAQAACLYISTLCTHPQHRGKGLAHQLVHAVYTLGSLLLEQNRKEAKGAWHNALPSQQLYLGLNVRCDNKQPDGHTKLIRMYSQCGLTTKTRVPAVKHSSFTPYSIYEWQFDNDPLNMIPMWQEVYASVLYEDSQIRILKPGDKNGNPMFHAFPREYMTAVSKRGIVHARHAYLITPPNTADASTAEKESTYISDEIRFTRTISSESICFCINAALSANTDSKGVSTEDNGTVLSISVPPWFGCIKDNNGDIPGVYTHRSYTHSRPR